MIQAQKPKVKDFKMFEIFFLINGLYSLPGCFLFRKKIYEVCDSLRSILQAKQGANDSKGLDDEITAMMDKLLKHK